MLPGTGKKTRERTMQRVNVVVADVQVLQIQQVCERSEACQASPKALKLPALAINEARRTRLTRQKVSGQFLVRHLARREDCCS